jgi:hypothetical protein
MLHYAVTIFCSAFLLFLVQPMLAKFILPWFGGGSVVWTTAMIFFQFTLLLGYTYAHLSTKWFSPKRGAMIHIGLLAIALLFLPIIPGASWKPLGDEEPAVRILLLLTATIGLPYFLLSSTSPLVQAWLARSIGAGHIKDANPYRLFALSNFASFGALISYPLVFEPFVNARSQAWGWSVGFVVFALLCGSLAWAASKHASSAQNENAVPQAAAPTAAAKPNLRQIGTWLALSAMGSIMLLAVSNHLTHEIPSIPLLWVAPLALYLLSFVLTFESQRWYQRDKFFAVFAVSIFAMAVLLGNHDWAFKVYWHIGVFLTGLFIACMFCHGELVRQKPATEHLTLFYLIVSAGGVIGGVLVGLVAPHVLAGYFELDIALIAFAIIAALLFMKQGPGYAFIILAVLVSVSTSSWVRTDRFYAATIESTRNAYGVLRVREYEKGTDSHYYSLTHGAILHGNQFRKEEFRRAATTYYKSGSGIGLTLLAKDGKAIKVGVIGLGAGTLATYGDPDDIYRFYDINPEVIRIAKSQFTYLADSEAKIETVLGDARLQLERELTNGQNQQFDVLAVDAFSSDSIPIHLITDEAVKLYAKHMKPTGVIAFHVSNRFLELKPILIALAERNGFEFAYLHQVADDKSTVSDWCVLTKDKSFLTQVKIATVTQPVLPEPKWSIWTDDHHNLLQVLK